MRHPVADLRLNRLETCAEAELDRFRAGEPTLEGIDDRLRAGVRLLPCLRAREDCDADARLWFHVLEEQADELLVVERMPHDKDAFRAFERLAELTPEGTDHVIGLVRLYRVREHHDRDAVSRVVLGRRNRIRASRTVPVRAPVPAEPAVQMQHRDITREAFTDEPVHVDDSVAALSDSRRLTPVGVEAEVLERDLAERVVIRGRVHPRRVPADPKYL